METEHTPTRVLVVDDEESQRTALAGMIALWGYAVETAADGQEALDKLADFRAHVIVTDLMMPRMTGQELLQRLKAQGNGPAAIVQTAFGNLETAIVADPRSGRVLVPGKAGAIAGAAPAAGARGGAGPSGGTRRAAGTPAELSGRAGRNGGRVAEDAGSVRADPPGGAQPGRGADHRRKRHGQGTGGARDSHARARAGAGPFVAINCAAMPDTLMESELFGHEKGAFTGAVERRAGCFELAQNGTVLLDEIGDMPMATQAKLLRVLEDGRVRRLGGKTEIQLDVRVIASTNSSARQRDPRRQVPRGPVLPAERFPDSPAAAARSQGRYAGAGAGAAGGPESQAPTKVTELLRRCWTILRTYAWPGNVRELRNVLERAVILAGEGTIQHGTSAAGYSRAAAVRAGFRGCCSSAGQRNELRIPVGYTIEQAERALIELTLEHTKNNKTRAAEILGISQKTLFNKLKEYGAQDGPGAA